jgi:RHH-type proline utilization regulon transcriptional repressor/proline dehydrogenase/delta 1-pyrroline-5-carboxylate dehydrogenase
VVTLIVTQQDGIAEAEKQIASALLCGCSVIVAADSCHQQKLKGLQDKYVSAKLPRHLLQLAPLESLPGLIQDDQIEAIVANTLGAKSSSLRQAMAKRSASIIPLIEWPHRDQDYTYYWLLWFLGERTRTENLVARGGNTQLFNLEE